MSFAGDRVNQKRKLVATFLHLPPALETGRISTRTLRTIVVQKLRFNDARVAAVLPGTPPQVWIGVDVILNIFHKENCYCEPFLPSVVK